MIGAPEAWAAGLDGTGVTVAVLDTGIDATHPDLAEPGRRRRSASTANEDTADGHGHGTHVASTIARHRRRLRRRGTRASPPAPTCWSARSSTTRGSGADSWVIAGMEWAADRAPTSST